jgi:hypothetical protein
MRLIAIPFVLLFAACSSRADEQRILAGSWTWDGTNCAERRYEFTDDSIRAVLPDENVIMYKILKTYVGEGKQPEVVLDLQLLPQRGMSADTLQFLKDSGGVHSMSLKLEGGRMRPLTLSMNGNSTKIVPGEPTFNQFSLHRCPAGGVA